MRKEKWIISFFMGEGKWIFKVFLVLILLIIIVWFKLYNSIVYLKGNITNINEILTNLSSLETVSKKLYTLYQEEYSNNNTLNSVDLFMTNGEVYIDYNYDNSNHTDEKTAFIIELTQKEYDSLTKVYDIIADLGKYEGIIRANSNGVLFPGGAYYNIYWFFDGTIPEKLQNTVEHNENYKLKQLSLFYPRLFIFMYSYD